MIDDPQLRARLSYSDEAFLSFITGLVQSFGPREFGDAVYERALSYPWSRPVSSYFLSGEHVEPVEDATRAACERASQDRHPLLAFGSNGAPGTLARKLAGLPEHEREMLVVAGDLHDFDVGAAPLPTYYGALPATIFPSPGTAVRASVLWVTAAQLTALAQTEFSYFLGRLDGVRFQPDLAAAEPIDGVLGFVSRWGALCVNDEIVALEAVPASGRAAAAMTQERLLDHVARLVFGDRARARDLVRRVTEDYGATGTAIAQTSAATTRQFESRHWTRYQRAVSGSGPAST